MNIQIKNSSSKPKKVTTTKIERKVSSVKKATVTAPAIKKSVRTDHKFQLLTRHPSYAPLRKLLPRMAFRLIARFGSTTVVEDAMSKGGKTLEINEVRGVRNSASKLLMKKCFTAAGVTSASWWTVRAGKFCQADDQTKVIALDKLPFPLIVKSHHGSRGEGNSLCKTPAELTRFMSSRDMSNYILEEYMTYSREYRLHINAIDGTCFYTCIKLIKNDTPEEERFQRHDDNCVWYVESNPKFDKPVNWDKIVSECIKAIRSVGLDVGAIDLKVQSAKDSKGNTRKDPAFIVIETCSAPSMGDITTERYTKELPKLAITKAKQLSLI